MLLSLGFELIPVNPRILKTNIVGNRIEPFTRLVWWRTVSQMPTRRQAQTKDRIAWFYKRQKHRLIGLRSRMGLNIGVCRAEQFFDPLNRQIFCHIHMFTTAIIPTSRIAFGIFVGHNRAGRFQYGTRYNVFGGDQLDLVALATKLIVDCRSNIGICIAKGI